MKGLASATSRGNNAAVGCNFVVSNRKASANPHKMSKRKLSKEEMRLMVSIRVPSPSPWRKPLKRLSEIQRARGAAKKCPLVLLPPGTFRPQIPSALHQQEQRSFLRKGPEGHTNPPSYRSGCRSPVRYDGGFVCPSGPFRRKDLCSC